MALIKCPECNKDVSDTAEKCPSCGYNIKRYIQGKKKQETKQESKNNKVPINKVLILVIFLAIVIIGIFIGIQRQHDKYALINLNLLFSHTKDISEYKTYAVMEVNGKCYYHDVGANTAISKISQRLSNLDICVEYIDEHYSESKKAIDDKIEEETNYGCRTWKEYRERLSSNYFIDENISNEERAEKIVSRYVDLKVD